MDMNQPQVYICPLICLPTLPLPVSQSTGPSSLCVSCSKSPLDVYLHTEMYMSPRSSVKSSHPLSPTVSTDLFSMSAGLMS